MCSKCLNQDLTSDDFYLKKERNKLGTICKKCIHERNMIWRENNKDKVRAQVSRSKQKQKIKRIENKQPRKKRVLSKSEQNKIDRIKKAKERHKDFLYWKRTEKRILIKAEKRRQAEFIKKWKSIIKNEKKRIKICSKIEDKELKRIDRKIILKEKARQKKRICHKAKIRSIISKSLRSGGYTKKSKSFEILGCEYEVFKKHIERQFTDGMNWDNYGIDGWHYDHIMPLSTAKSYEDIVRLNHYTNLQPLWAKDNMSKSDNIIEHQVKLPI